MSFRVLALSLALLSRAEALSTIGVQSSGQLQHHSSLSADRTPSALIRLEQNAQPLPTAVTHPVAQLPETGANGQPPTWQYWDYCSGASPCPPLSPYGGAALPADEQFLIAETRGSGWNNERQSLELAYALAYVWRRTLVLPAWLGDPGNPAGLTQVNVSFDQQAMSSGIKVMTASEFVAYAKANPNRFPGAASAVDALHVHSDDHWKGTIRTKVTGWFNGIEGVAEKLFESLPDEKLFDSVIIGDTLAAPELEKLKASEDFQRFATKQRLDNVLALSDKEAQATALYIGYGKLLGNYYSKIYVPTSIRKRQLHNTIRRALHLRPEYFAAAEAALQFANLTPGKYGAIHDRQGDWDRAFKSWYMDPKNPAHFLSSLQNLDFLRQHGKMYVASNPIASQAMLLKDTFEPALRQEMPEPKKIINFEEVQEAAKPIVGNLPGWQGLVEMIICAQAGTFIGSWGSTYTGYIHRIRGYMPFITDKRMLYMDSKMSDHGSLLSPSWGKSTADIGQMNWEREWPEGFQSLLQK